MSGQNIRFVRKVLLLLMVLTLVGCVPAVRQIDSRYTLSEDSGNGVVIASVTYQGGYSQYAVDLRATGQTATQRMQIGSAQTIIPAGMQQWDIEAPGTRGQLFSVELPAGSYEIAEWTAGSGAASMDHEDSFTIPFEVLSGQITYIGNFNFKATGRMGAMITNLNVIHSDEFDRDAEVAARKFPHLELDRVAYAIVPGYHQEMIGGRTRTTLTIFYMP